LDPIPSQGEAETFSNRSLNTREKIGFLGKLIGQVFNCLATPSLELIHGEAEVEAASG